MSRADGAAAETAEARLLELGIELPPLPAPVGNFVYSRSAGGLAYMSGQGPLLEDGTMATGKVGRDVGADEARAHARRTGLVLLAAMRAEFGSLDRVRSVVKLLGMVNATPEFADHPKVIDGCSDLLVEVFGAERGSHARSAVGVGSLPNGITVEIEAVVSLAG